MSALEVLHGVPGEDRCACGKPSSSVDKGERAIYETPVNSNQANQNVDQRFNCSDRDPNFAFVHRSVYASNCRRTPTPCSSPKPEGEAPWICKSLSSRLRIAHTTPSRWRVHRDLVKHRRNGR